MAYFYTKPCKIRLADGETPVNPHLAMTPQEMAQRTQKGQTIAAQTLADSAYFDGTSQAENLPLLFQRGIDANTLWEDAKRTKNKIKNFSREQLAKIKKQQRDGQLN